MIYYCKTADFKSIVQFAFELSATELKIFFELSKCKTNQCVLSIASKVHRDRTTIQKVLIKLYKKGLVEKKKTTFEEGGYKFIYVPISKNKLKKEVMNNINSWYKDVKIIVDSF